MPKDNHMKSTDDARTTNAVRHEYRVLSNVEKLLMAEVKDRGLALLEAIDAISAKGSAGRECALAKTKTEEAVMWAVKGLTK